MSITCMCSISEYQYVIVGSTDQSIGIYDINSKECCGRINDLNSIPTAICIYKVTVARCSIPLTYNKFYINDNNDEDDPSYNKNKDSKNKDNKKNNKNDNNNDNDSDDDNDSSGLVEVFRICCGEENGDITIGIIIVIIIIIIIIIIIVKLLLSLSSYS